MGTMLPVLCSVHLTSRTKLVRGGLRWRKGKGKRNANKKELKQEQAAEEQGHLQSIIPQAHSTS